MTSPTHGTLSGVAPDLTYTPAADFHGADLKGTQFVDCDLARSDFTRAKLAGTDVSFAVSRFGGRHRPNPVTRTVSVSSTPPA